MDAKESMQNFLTELGCKRRNELFILDGFDFEFYLVFDLTWEEELGADKYGTVDILVSSTGEVPANTAPQMRIVADCTRHHVMRFLFALGVQRFSEKTKAFLYASNKVIRAN